MIKAWESVRGAWRLLALIVVILGAGGAYVLNRRNRRDAAGKARWLQHTCRRALKTLAVSIHSRGIPARGAVIVSNHLSYMDILVLAALTPVVFVSKKEVRGWPVFGWFAEKAGTRFIDRTKRGDVRRISTEIEPVISADLTVVLFLEGTTTDGSGILPFKSSLLEPAISHGWKIVPAALNYAVPAGRSAKQEVCWWGDMTLAPHLLNFTTLPWVRAEVSWGTPLIPSDDRKQLSGVLYEQVSSLKAGLGTSV